MPLDESPDMFFWTQFSLKFKCLFFLWLAFCLGLSLSCCSVPRAKGAFGSLPIFQFLRSNQKLFPPEKKTTWTHFMPLIPNLSLLSPHLGNTLNGCIVIVVSSQTLHCFSSDRHFMMPTVTKQLFLQIFRLGE